MYGMDTNNGMGLFRAWSWLHGQLVLGTNHGQILSRTNSFHERYQGGSREISRKTWLFLSTNLGYRYLKHNLLRVIPTMTFIHFVAGKSSGILSDISSGILSGIPSGILSGISSGILSTQIFWHSIWQTFWHFIWHIFWHSIGILSGISSRILSDILSGILSGFWGPAVRTELGRPQVEVQRCALNSAGPRLRSSGAHWARKVPGWGPAVRTELGRSQVEVQQCALSSEVGEELGQELARQQWTWKWRQRW